MIVNEESVEETNCAYNGLNKSMSSVHADEIEDKQLTNQYFVNSFNHHGLHPQSLRNQETVTN
jgi:hypothetical protein